MARERSEGMSWPELYALDRAGMLAALARFPDQCREGFALGERVPVDSLAGFSRVVALGMGGSGIAGDLLAHLLSVEVIPVRTYTLPRWVGEESLLLALSYSGDTEETLSAFADGLGRTRRALAVTSGGALGRLCTEKGIPWVRIPGGHQPRAALGYLLFPLLAVFRGLGTFREDLAETLSILDEQARALGPASPGNPAQELALLLHGRVPLVCGAGPAAVRWKTQVNENAKQPAFWAELPELCHNEIVGWELAGKVFPNGVVVFLRSRHDHPRVQARIEILKEVLDRRGLPYLEVQGQGEGALAQTFSLLYLGDWASVYLALLNGADPTPVRPILELKERLAGWEPGRASGTGPDLNVGDEPRRYGPLPPLMGEGQGEGEWARVATALHGRRRRGEEEV
ncbi:MAG: bifunctional phosphoglucose/phosphomannose isomerase [Candidatus Acetothermia bacterium]|nr:bifunctional phosphoglucose/phosphomannose isomerase [Candidatus Acetothermia bacterium]